MASEVEPRFSAAPPNQEIVCTIEIDCNSSERVIRDPPSYLTICVIATILNPVIGPAAFIYRYMSTRELRRGHRQLAHKYSMKAGCLAVIGIFITVVTVPVAVVAVSTANSRAINASTSGKRFQNQSNGGNRSHTPASKNKHYKDYSNENIPLPPGFKANILKRFNIHVNATKWIQDNDTSNGNPDTDDDIERIDRPDMWKSPPAKDVKYVFRNDTYVEYYGKNGTVTVPPDLLKMINSQFDQS